MGGDRELDSGFPPLRTKAQCYTKYIARGRNGFDRLAKASTVMQVESGSPLANQRSKQNVTANNIVPFARKAAAVA